MLYQQELKEALTAAQAAGQIQLKSQYKGLSVKRKSDKSPVTEVDQLCECTIRDHLLKNFPSDGFLGEETGLFKGKSSRTWIVDPLDGTRPFIKGIPTYSTLIALEDKGIPCVGIIHLPAMDITCWASNGNGAFKNGSEIHVSSTKSLSDAIGSTLGYIECSDTQTVGKLLSFMKSLDYHYGFMDAFTYVCIADGRLDCAVNLLDKPWDCAAPACIVHEAGGTFSDLSGFRSVHNGSIILSNGNLEEQILGLFK